MVSSRMLLTLPKALPNAPSRMASSSPRLKRGATLPCVKSSASSWPSTSTDWLIGSPSVLASAKTTPVIDRLIGVLTTTLPLPFNA